MEEKKLVINGFEVTPMEFQLYMFIFVRGYDKENGIAEIPVQDITKKYTFEWTTYEQKVKDAKKVFEAMLSLADKKLIRFARMTDDERSVGFCEQVMRCKIWSRQDEYL